MKYWLWRIRYWWAFLPWVRKGYRDGYRMAWNDSTIEGMDLDETAAYNEWLSRLGDNY